MTLIQTAITQFGIIQLSDSRMIVKRYDEQNGNLVAIDIHDKTVKLFQFAPIPLLIAVAGSNSVKGKDIAEWMTEFFTNNLNMNNIMEFTVLFQTALLQMDDTDRGLLPTFHIAGYWNTTPHVYRISYNQTYNVFQSELRNDGTFIDGAGNAVFSLQENIRHNNIQLDSLQAAENHYSGLFQYTINQFTEKERHNPDGSIIEPSPIGGSVAFKTILLPCP